MYGRNHIKMETAFEDIHRSQDIPTSVGASVVFFHCENREFINAIVSYFLPRVR